MSVYGGDIKEIKWDNPDVGSGYFFPVAGEDNTWDIGGYRNDDNGAVDGARRLIVSKNLKPGGFEQVVSNDMADTKEYEAAVALSQAFSDTVFTFSTTNGIVYKGVGIIVGDLKLSTNKATFTLKVSAGAGFAQQ